MKKQLLAEFLGSLFLLTIVNGVVILFSATFGGGDFEAVLTSAIAVAAILFVIIELFGPISGAHFNPVVTMVMLFEKKVTMSQSLNYIIMQISGGLLGIIISHVMFWPESGVLLAISEVTRSDFNYFAEFVGTFMLIFAVLVLTKTKNKRASLIIPLLVGANILSISSTMFANPMVTFARMFTNSGAGVRPLDGFMFIIMQIVGGLVAYLVYKMMFKKEG